MSESEIEIRNQDNISDTLRTIESGLENPLFSIFAADSRASRKAPEFFGDDAGRNSSTDSP